jgi:hypothetical protein
LLTLPPAPISHAAPRADGVISTETSAVYTTDVKKQPKPYARSSNEIGVRQHALIIYRWFFTFLQPGRVATLVEDKEVSFLMVTFL